MVKVSIIIPIYNVEKYLQKCLESVRNQTLKDFEAICINDGSTDGSQEILKYYVKLDPRFKLIEQSNQGLSSARNAGLKEVKGEYIAFLDSDDSWHPDFLMTLYQGIIETQSDIVGCRFKVIRNNNTRHSGKPKHQAQWEVFQDPLSILLDRKNPISFCVWNKLYRKDAVLNKFRFVEGIYYEDWVFITCLFSEMLSFAFIKQELYFYQESPRSIMRTQFTKEKINSYKTGIEEVFQFFYQKNKMEVWPTLKQTRIARTVKMMINQERRSQRYQKDLTLRKHLKATLLDLKKRELISYQGLNWINKIRLFNIIKSF